MKNVMNKIGVNYSILYIICLFGGLVLEWVLGKIMPGFLEGNETNFQMIKMIVIVYICGFSTIFLCTRKMPKAELGKKKLKFGQYLLMILLSAALVLVGTVVGLVPDRVCGSLAGSNGANPLGDIMMNGNLVLRFLVVAILAPVFEELMFRKILIDRVATKGKFLAILTSGLFFGLFHGNFSQFFYAMFLGFLFAYIYIETGNVLYTMGLHIIINSSSTILSFAYVALGKGLEKIGLSLDSLNFMTNEQVVEAFSKPGAEMATAATVFVLAWMVFELLVALCGLVAWVVLLLRKKISLPKSETEESFGKQTKKLFTSWGVWVFFAISIMAFVMMYINSGRAASSEIPEWASPTATHFEMDVTVPGDATIPPLSFEVETAGKYELDFYWDAEKDSDPYGFLIGAVVLDKDGNVMNSLTGGGVLCQCPTDLEAGEYTVEYTILKNEDEFGDYVRKYVDPEYSDDSEFEFADGTCHMKFAFECRKMK